MKIRNKKEVVHGILRLNTVFQKMTVICTTSIQDWQIVSDLWHKRNHANHLIHHSYEESYSLFINYRKLFMVDKSRGIRCLNVFSKKEKTITLHFISYTIGLIITWHYCVILEKHILKTKYIRRWIQLL